MSARGKRARAGTKKRVTAQKTRPLPPSTLSPSFSPPLKLTGPACTRCRWRAGRPESRPAWPVKVGMRETTSVGPCCWPRARPPSRARGAQACPASRQRGGGRRGPQAAVWRGAIQPSVAPASFSAAPASPWGARTRRRCPCWAEEVGREKGRGQTSPGPTKIESELYFRFRSLLFFARFAFRSLSRSSRTLHRNPTPHGGAPCGRRAGPAAGSGGGRGERGINWGGVCFRMRLSARSPGSLDQPRPAPAPPPTATWPAHSPQLMAAGVEV